MASHLLTKVCIGNICYNLVVKFLLYIFLIFTLLLILLLNILPIFAWSKSITNELTDVMLVMQKRVIFSFAAYTYLHVTNIHNYLKPNSFWQQTTTFETSLGAFKNLFYGTNLFLCPMKILENIRDYWYFQGV